MNQRFFKAFWIATICIVSAALSFIVNCTTKYNPFEDINNAGISITRQSINDGDTVNIFSAETLQIIVTVKERMQEFSIHADHNRYWSSSDTTINATQFDREPFVFHFSFFDTGWHDITIDAQRQDGTRKTDTIFLYVQSPLKQVDISAFEGDSITLRTASVGDRDINYCWSFGSSTQYVSLLCSTSVKISAAVFNGTGFLWVSDGRHLSPCDSFSFSLVDRIAPKIQCVNTGFEGKDTILTGDTIFYFKTLISDGPQKGVDSASINGERFDGVSSGIYYKVFPSMHRYGRNNPLKITVYALDRFQFGNDTTSSFVVIFSDTITPSTVARIVVQTPAVDTVSTQADSFYVSGIVEDRSLDTFNLTMLLYVNGNLNSTARAINKANYSWEWKIPLLMGENVVRIVATSISKGTVDEKYKLIVRNPLAPDTVAPQLLDILADGVVANGLFTIKRNVVVRVKAVDDGRGVDTVRINNENATVVAGIPYWYQDTVLLEHVRAGNEIVVSARDRSGNETRRTVVIFRNSKPIVQTRPVSQNISIDSLYIDSIAAIDPDADTVSYSISTGPSSMVISSTGRISWTPTIADTGIKQITIRIWDGYQPVYETYTVHVYRTGSLPPRPVQFATRVTDFPSFLEAGYDTMRITLRAANGTGVSPFRYSARLVKTGTKLLKETPESTLVWTPALADTGYNQLVVYIKDALGNGDTLYPNVLVVAPNKPFNITVSFSAPTLANGAVDLNRKRMADTLRFRISDPDPRQIERHRISILLWRSRLSTTIDSTAIDTFSVVVDPSALTGYDTVIVTVSDLGGNVSTFKQTIYYGTPPNAVQTLVPLNASTIGSTSTTLSWQCVDSDTDSLYYEVFLGTSTGMNKIGQTSQTTYSVTSLIPSTLYYWQIIAHDWKSSTSGQVRWFTTGP